MRFKKGDRVVCIDDTVIHPNIKHVFSEWIKKDSIYTVRGNHIGLEGKIGVLLNEIHNMPILFPMLGGKAEPAYAEHRFVKIDDLLNEISLKALDSITNKR
jgi:hypothetical protein